MCVKMSDLASNFVNQIGLDFGECRVRRKSDSKACQSWIGALGPKTHLIPAAICVLKC